MLLIVRQVLGSDIGGELSITFSNLTKPTYGILKTKNFLKLSVRNNQHFTTICIQAQSALGYLSVTNDGRRPWERRRVLKQEPRVDGEGEDVVEVVDDEADERDAANGQNDHPEDPPEGVLGQLKVVKSVSRSPKVEPYRDNSETTC